MNRTSPTLTAPVLRTAPLTRGGVLSNGVATPVMPSTQQSTMNNTNHPHEVIVSGIHLDLTPSLKTYVLEKMERLFRHESHIVRIRVDLECDRKHDHQHKFIAKANMEVRGPNIIATAESEEMHKSIDLLVDKLDQSVRKRHGQMKDKRNHPHPVELQDVSLPKVG